VCLAGDLSTPVSKAIQAFQAMICPHNLADIKVGKKCNRINGLRGLSKAGFKMCKNAKINILKTFGSGWEKSIPGGRKYDIDARANPAFCNDLYVFVEKKSTKNTQKKLLIGGACKKRAQRVTPKTTQGACKKSIIRERHRKPRRARAKRETLESDTEICVNVDQFVDDNSHSSNKKGRSTDEIIRTGEIENKEEIKKKH